MSKGNSDGIGFIILISLITISISFIQTAIGYKPLFGYTITWVVSGVISLFMLRTNLQIRNSIQQRKAVVGLVLFYLVIATVSFIGNFNAFYSRFMRAELYDRELREYKAAIPALANEATIALKKSNNFQEVEGEVKKLKLTLVAQIKNPRDCGYGGKAQKIGEKIKNLTGTELTRLNGSCAEIATLMGEQVDQILAQMKESMNQDVTPLIANINTSSTEALSVIQSALNPGVIKVEGRSALEKGLSTYNSICSTTKGVLPSFNCENKSPKNLEVGQLNHTFNSAFGEVQNTSSTLISVFASLLIDFLVPVYIFLTVSSDTSGSETSGSNSRSERRIPKRRWWDRFFGGGNNNSGAKQL